MPRNIILCCDGTNNEFGKENTSVVRLIQAVDRDPLKQHVYYDPGVGTLPEPSVWSALGKWLSKVFGLAFGGGIFWKTEEAYSYLMDFWEPGDRVYLFGFSRGAYTARLLAAVLHQLGLLPRGNYNLVPYVMRLFKALHGEQSAEAVHGYFSLCNEFRWSFARYVPESPSDRRFRIHFLGLWDTVSSVGWVWDPPAYPFTAKNPSVDVIRHAVSIDERRAFFRQNLMRQARPDQDLLQMWFPGVHSDVGGGYPEDQGGLWRAPFSWMLNEAKSAGLAFDDRRVSKVLTRSPVSTEPCLDRQHESLRPLWWPAEFFPKLVWRGEDRSRRPALSLGRRRSIEEGALIHRCALLRLRGNADYRPANLSNRFIESVRSLADVPDFMDYRA
jgi:uncharacterized protein (DUF2235 family)